MFAQLFQLFLTEIEGTMRLRVGGYQIHLVTTQGTSGFAIQVTPYTPPQAAA